MRSAEIHFHLLPGLDDGPASVEESLELARMAVVDGTGTIVATPHVSSFYPTDVRSLPERVQEVQDRLRKKRVSIRVRCGGELAPEMVARLSHAELETIALGPSGHRWLLLEAPLTGVDNTFADAASELRGRGFGIVVAHPERSLGSVESGWRLLDRQLRAGSALQLSAWSLAGLNGDRARSNALRLLHAAPLVAVASDAHGPERAPALKLALAALPGSARPTRPDS
jgi:protein-tyrosine phosphatase